MGAAVSTSTSSNIQNTVNNTYQSAKSACTADCNQTISGNTIVLTNSKAGNVNFTQKCTADASCYMTNAVDQAVAQYQAAKVSASASPALFPGIQVNTSIASNKQDITNNLTQVLETICKADVNQTIQNNIIYATDSTLGNIGFTQEGNANAKCVMENSARLQLQIKQEGEVTAKAGGTSSLIALIVAVVVVIIIIGIVMRAMKKNQGDSQDQPEGQQQKKSFGGPYANKNNTKRSSSVSLGKARGRGK